MLEIERLSIPFEKFSRNIVIGNIQLLKQGIDHPFIVFTDKARLLSRVFSERLSWLRKSDKALRSFKKRTDKIEQIRGLYINIREAHDRRPSGYVTEIRVVIPDSNRGLEYRIYDTFRELLKASRPLLFDLHIIKLRDRELEEAIPEGFWRYR